MKVTVGGSISHKFFARPYEPIDVTSMCRIEFDTDDENFSKDVDKYNAVAMEVIKKENRKKMASAFIEHNKKLQALKEI